MVKKALAIVVGVIVLLMTGLGVIYAKVPELIQKSAVSVTQKVYGTPQATTPKKQDQEVKNQKPSEISKTQTVSAQETPLATSKPREENKPDEFTGKDPAKEGNYVGPSNPPPLPKKEVIKDPCTVTITNPKPNSIIHVPVTVSWSIVNRTNFRAEYMFYVTDLSNGRAVYSTDTGSRTSVTIPSDVGQGPIFVENHSYELRVTTNLIYTGPGRTPFPLLDTVVKVSTQK